MTRKELVWRRKEGFPATSSTEEGRGLTPGPALKELRNSVGLESRVWAEDGQEIRPKRYTGVHQKGTVAHLRSLDFVLKL